jgi:hypothetical protein
VAKTNILMISLMGGSKRGLYLYFFNHKSASNLSKKKGAIFPVFKLKKTSSCH